MNNPDIIREIYDYVEPTLDDKMEKYENEYNVCKLFLLGKCYDKYCKYNHYVKKKNFYIIPGTDFICLENPSSIDPKYNRIEKETHMSDLEIFRNKLIYDAENLFKENQLKRKKKFYTDEKNMFIPNLNEEDKTVLSRIYPKYFNDKDIINNKCGLPSSYEAAMSNTIDWDREKKKLENI